MGAAGEILHEKKEAPNNVEAEKKGNMRRKQKQKDREKKDSLNSQGTSGRTVLYDLSSHNNTI